MRDTAEWYRGFGEVEAPGRSEIYRAWALGVAADPVLLALVNELPETKRQPSLLFAVARLLGSGDGDFPSLRAWLIENWQRARPEVEARLNQTNEPGRCASLLPALAGIPGPLALLEVGASAGLCLYPDRYSYRYGGHPALHPSDGESAVLLESEISGPVSVPDRMPDIVWRAGIDLQPVDVNVAGDREWLETLAWPEERDRLARIRSAIEIVRSDPPLIVRGDATDALAGLAARAPAGATLVVITSGVLVYLPYRQRLRFIDAVRELDARWVSLEGIAVLPEVQRLLPADPGRFVLALDEQPLAYAGAHGHSLEWFATGTS